MLAMTGGTLIPGAALAGLATSPATSSAVPAAGIATAVADSYLETALQRGVQLELLGTAAAGPVGSAALGTTALDLLVSAGARMWVRPSAVRAVQPLALTSSARI